MADAPATGASAQSPMEDTEMIDAGATEVVTTGTQAKSDVKLDELFADVDSDDEEFPSSRPQAPKASQSSGSSSPAVLTPTS